MSEIAAAMTPSRVLVLEADAARATDLGHRLRFLNYEPVIAGEADAPVDPMDGIALVIGDAPAGSALDRTARNLLAARPHMPVLLASDDGHSGTRFERHGAWRLDLPIRRAQLKQLLERAERYEGREQRQRITGSCHSIREVRRLIEQVADFDTSVLVTGESGTGKEMVARTIHDLSARAKEAFVPLNCGAIPPDLLESELFGHEKGAFTGAISDRVGRFELAEGGTLFLDEIGDMSLPMQVKLLRVLQERQFERVGSNRTRRSNVRIIAATHRNLPEMVAEGTFREDLYYRLNVFPIDMPPLAKRVSDLPQLLDELLLRHNPDRTLRLSPEALSALARYSWPGNIRELGNLVERLAILHPEGEIGLDDLPAKYRVPANDDTPLTEAEFRAAPVAANLKQYLKDVERSLIEKALAETDGVVAQAARLLRMQRTTLLEKINKHELAQ